MFDKPIQFLEKAMDISAFNRKMISDNIANYNTPEYKRNITKFEEYFQNTIGSELKKTNEKHMDLNNNGKSPEVEKDMDSRERFDGNNVDLTKEMVEMTKNNYLFNTSVQAINKDFLILKTAIGN